MVMSLKSFRLPNHVSFDEGALVEPISVGVYACQRAQIKVGSRVLVCGSGMQISNYI